MRKKGKNKLKDIFKYIIIFCILIIITLIIIVTSLENIDSKEDKVTEKQIEVEVQKQKEESLKESENSIIKNKLSDMGERDRMEYYFSQFIEEIENKNYDKAYEMLYDDFKTNYFPTLNDFEQYAKKTFPKMMAIEHTNFERNGDVYILFITLSNMLSPDETSNKEMKFVIKENEINDFVMSFSVI